MNHHFPLHRIVTLSLALASVGLFSACSLNRQAKQESSPVKPLPGLTFQTPEAASSRGPGSGMDGPAYAAAPSPAPTYPAHTPYQPPQAGQGYQPFAQPQETPVYTVQPSTYQAPTGVIQRTSAEVPVEQPQPTIQTTARPVQHAVPARQVGYAYPRGQAMPPCGPDCLPPTTMCMHGSPLGQCAHCRPAGGVGYEWVPFWPADEYVCDGGDMLHEVEIDGEFGVHGLDIEDTVGHYDTLNGQRRVAPSNRVCVYAPRFAAVRTVTNIHQDIRGSSLAGMDANLKLNNQQHLGTPAGVLQPLALRGHVGGQPANALQEDQSLVRMHGHTRLAQFQEEFAAYENLSIVRLGIFDQGEKPRLAASLQNAATWTNALEVQVMVEGRKASEVAGEQTAQEMIWTDLPGEPHLRVVKVASAGDAKSGDIIEFTLRFDNVGDQVMGNVTILDNLSPRLEYIEGTAECSIDAEFFTQPNERGSQVLRWEISNPLETGEGGICRFKCRVR